MVSSPIEKKMFVIHIHRSNLFWFDDENVSPVDCSYLEEFTRVLNFSTIVNHVFLSGTGVHFSFKLHKMLLPTVLTISLEVIFKIIKLKCSSFKLQHLA